MKRILGTIFLLLFMFSMVFTVMGCTPPAEDPGAQPEDPAPADPVDPEPEDPAPADPAPPVEPPGE